MGLVNFFRNIFLILCTCLGVDTESRRAAEVGLQSHGTLSWITRMACIFLEMGVTQSVLIRNRLAASVNQGTITLMEGLISCANRLRDEAYEAQTNFLKKRKITKAERDALPVTFTKLLFVTFNIGVFLESWYWLRPRVCCGSLDAETVLLIQDSKELLALKEKRCGQKGCQGRYCHYYCTICEQVYCDKHKVGHFKKGEFVPIGFTAYQQ